MKKIMESSIIMPESDRFVLFDMIDCPILKKDPLPLRISFLRSLRMIETLQGYDNTEDEHLFSISHNGRNRSFNPIKVLFYPIEIIASILYYL